MILLMSESLERRLGVLEHLELKLHLMVCAWCARYLKQIKFLRQLVRQRTFATATDTGSPVALSRKARQRIGRSLLKNPESCSGTHAADLPKD
jgi:hypothetical protein